VGWRKKTRRYWSEAERRQIVAASYAPGASMAAVARRYDINAHLLWNWRRALRQVSLVEVVHLHVRDVGRPREMSRARSATSWAVNSFTLAFRLLLIVHVPTAKP